jgi:hypothetical protein
MLAWPPALQCTKAGTSDLQCIISEGSANMRLDYMQERTRCNRPGKLLSTDSMSLPGRRDHLVPTGSLFACDMMCDGICTKRSYKKVVGQKATRIVRIPVGQRQLAGFRYPSLAPQEDVATSVTACGAHAVFGERTSCTINQRVNLKRKHMDVVDVRTIRGNR